MNVLDVNHHAGRFLEVENGAIVEVFPDGSRKFIKQIDPAIPAQLGQKRVSA